MEINECFCGFIESKRINIKKSTISHYMQTALLHIYPISHMQGFTAWDKVTKEQVNTFLYENKIKYQLSDKSMYDIKTLWNAFLKYCFENKQISEYIIIPNKKPKQAAITIFSDTECDKLERYLLSNIEFVNVSILLCLLCGLRIGEACALQWQDLDLDNGIIHVIKTLQRIKDLDPHSIGKTKLIIDTPKSVSSIRDIPIPDFIIPLLRQLKGLAGWYILSASTKPMEPRTLQKKYAVILHDSCIDYKDYKTLRHTFATRALQAGMDIKTLSELMGHENAGFTLKVYVHSSMELKKKEINSIYAGKRVITA